MKKIEGGTSARVRANRRNASKSTGPRTAEGKARVARNALVHGFTAQSFPAANPEHEPLTTRIAGTGADQNRLALAREIALADADMRRARRARQILSTLQAEPLVTPETLVRTAREFERTIGLITRFVEHRQMSKRVYKGRPLKIDNYPRFRGLFQKLAEVPERLDEVETSRIMREVALLSAAQARLLDRYEADALRRRKRAIDAFDELVRLDLSQASGA